MLVPNQLVEVVVGSHTFQHYKNLGYDVHKGDTILVPPHELTKGSHAIVYVQCDICGRIYPLKYNSYNKSTEEIDQCKDCSFKRMKQKCFEKYGNQHISAVPEIREKIKRTWINKYGTVHPLQNKEILAKLRQTNLEIYGVEYVGQNEEVKKKIKNTCMDKYGVEHLFQSEEIQDKIRQTNLERYGFTSPMKNAEIASKVRESLTENGTGKVSKQQIQLHKMIKNKYPNAELNYPFSTCSLDIFVCINNIKIDVEYDGSYWHQDKQRDIKRDKFLQSQGLKTLRIRSGHLIPTEQELFDAIDYLVNTEHHFKEIILPDWKECDE